MSVDPSYWWIAVSGPLGGQSTEIPRDRPLYLGAAHCAPAEGALIWPAGTDGLRGPFALDGAVLTGSLDPDGQRNLFPCAGPQRLAAGDLVDWGDLALLVSDRSPEWGEVLHSALHSPTGAPPPPGEAGLTAPVPLPRIFQSVYAGGPFDRCLLCDTLLLVEPNTYLVEKVYRGSEVILECAVCQGCAATVNGDLSEESRQHLESFARRLQSAGHGLARCRACGQPRGACRGFNIMSTCLLDQAIPGSWMLLCECCVDGLESTLSQQTRERFRDFVTDHFPGLPADSDLPARVFFSP